MPSLKPKRKSTSLEKTTSLTQTPSPTSVIANNSDLADYSSETMDEPELPSSNGQQCPSFSTGGWQFFALGLLAGWLALVVVGVRPGGLLRTSDGGFVLENTGMDVTELHAKWQLGSESARLRAARVDSVLAEAGRVGKAAGMATKESWAARKAAAEGGLTGAWDEVARDVAVVVRTEASTAAIRLPTLQDTWLQPGRVPNLIVVTDTLGPGVPQDALVATRVAKDLVRKLKSGDKGKGGVESSPGQGWEDQGGKDNTFLPALWLLHKAYPDVSYYMVVDDNAYVFLDSIGRMLKHRMGGAKEKPGCFGRGYLVTGCMGLSDSGYTNGERNPMFPQGDSGFLLSHYTVSKMVPHIGGCIRDFRGCWAGDMRVGLCLQAAGVDFEFAPDNNLNWFFPGTPAQLIEDDGFAKYRKSVEWPLTIPEVGMEEMQKLWAFEMDYGPYDTSFRNLVRHWKGERKIAASNSGVEGDRQVDPGTWTGVKTFLSGSDDLRRYLRQCYRRRVIPRKSWVH